MDSSYKRLLAIDDEPAICEFVGEVARDIGFEIVTETTFDAFKRSYHEFQPTFIVTDLAMPDADGIEILRFLSAELSKATIILMSGFDEKILGTAERLAVEQGLNVAGVLQKPIAITELEALLTVAPDLAGGLTKADLLNALEEGHLTPYFQPKVVCTGGAVRHEGEAEALVRWQHPDHGLLSPALFLPLAEQADLLAPLTRAVAEQVFRQMRLWNEQGLEMSVAINVAPQLLTNLELPDEFATLAKDSGVDSKRVIIEITETGVMEDAMLATDILTRFRLKGFRLSLDDFGTGFSSLIHLYRMPFSELKIDQSFVNDVGHREEARLIVRTISEMAHNLNLSVCAEGVEDQEMLDFVRSIGCDKAQGYFFSRPIPGAEIPVFFSGLESQQKHELEEQEQHG